MEGYMVGKRVVILGSGDIGLIMARRMTLEGAKVLACVEVMPYSGGLMRNIVQCLQDYDIPLYLSHTVTDIQAENGRLSHITVSKVGDDRLPIPGTEMEFDCDTLLLSVGLIPENELTRGAGIQMDMRTNGAIVYENMETSIPGVFACGNVVHVHDLVDYVSQESEKAGAAAADFVTNPKTDEQAVQLKNGNGVSYTVPQQVRIARIEKNLEVFFRVRQAYGQSVIEVKDGETLLCSFKREYMTPGEMQQIKLPKMILDKATGNTIEISVKEA